MPKLVKNINAEFIKEKEGTVPSSMGIESKFGEGTHFNVYGFIGYIQNFTRVASTTKEEVNKNKGISSNEEAHFNKIVVTYF